MRRVKTIQERMAQIKAAQDAGDFTCCPRCDENTMKPRLHTNALSRQYDIMICDLCGTDEAKMAFMGAPMPLAHWACMGTHTGDDFKAVPGAQALKQIEETQISYLKELYQLWLERSATRAPGADTDWEAYRLDAYEQCPGLTTLWFEPFECRYTVAEGTLVIQFRVRNGTPQYAAEILTD